MKTKNIKIINRILHRLNGQYSRGGVSEINVPELPLISLGDDTQPTDLFKQWILEARKKYKYADTMTVATSTNDGIVKNCNIYLSEWIDNDFLMLVNKNSTTANNLLENPRIAACFFWNYGKLGDYVVKVEGICEELPDKDNEELYNKLSFRDQIMAELYDEQMPYKLLQDRFKTLTKKLNDENLKLRFHQHMIGYKILPHTMIFQHRISDSLDAIVRFRKGCEAEWVTDYNKT